MNEKGMKWLTREGFDILTGYTYIYGGSDSYAIKDKLKESGFRFNPNTLWHIASIVNCPYADKCFPVHYNEVLEMMAYGEGHYYADAAKKIKARVAERNSDSNSEYITPDADGKIRVYAECIAKRQIESMYGLTFLYTFKADEDEIIWFSKSDSIDIGDVGNVTATFKKHDSYNGHKQTTVSRLKMEN